MTPRSLAELVAVSRLAEMQSAIVAELKRLLPGVTVTEHPGKLDVADVVAGTVMQAPGVGVGWTRIRAVRDVAGTYSTVVEWAAYVVAEDRADQVAKKAVRRETIAHAIGGFLLEILHDVDVASWGLDNCSPPLLDPAPEFRPVFTAKSFEKGTVYHAVTWSQRLIEGGRPIFDGPTPASAEDAAAVEFEALPPEFEAMLESAGEGQP